MIYISCKKRTPSQLYEGIFLKGNKACPNQINITKSFNNELPVNTTLNLVREVQAHDGQIVKFLILNYSLDTIIHNSLCAYGKYDASITLTN